MGATLRGRNLNPMRVLIIGGSGMLGHKIDQQLASRFETYTTFRGDPASWARIPQFRGRDTLLGGVDVTRFETVGEAFNRVRPDVVINCVGVVKQLKEAHDPILSLTINSLLPHRLAALCAPTGARLIHFSTDCIFSGEKGQYCEDDVPDARDLYGRTKLLGEVGGANCLTLRTSIIGRDYTRTTSLLEWLISNRGGRVTGYRNAIYSGFTTLALARIVDELITSHAGLSGVFHVASEPLSKYDLLVKLNTALRLQIEIKPDEKFRCDRSLRGERLAGLTGLRPPTWDEMTADLMADPTPYDDLRKICASP
jgi:dTDP-4-dehydrorhamnose reductase